MSPNSVRVPRDHPGLRRLIPLTPLRHFYDRLRDFPSDSFHREAARECLRRPDRLQNLVSKSLDHLRFYDNWEETFRPASDGLTLARSGNVDLANQLLRLMSTGATAVPACPRAEFDFVDYEINPLRTTGSEYENGVSGSKSGRGGIDVLLANRLDRFPAIGELKADTDRNPFLGFVQTLMYAVELATPAQQSRLARSYPEKLTCANNGPVIDLCLFLIRYPTDPAHREFLDLVRSIVEKLALPGSAFALMVRRVVCFHTDMDVVDRAEFRIVFES